MHIFEYILLVNVLPEKDCLGEKVKVPCQNLKLLDCSFSS